MDEFLAGQGELAQHFGEFLRPSVSDVVGTEIEHEERTIELQAAGNVRRALVADGVVGEVQRLQFLVLATFSAQPLPEQLGAAFADATVTKGETDQGEIVVGEENVVALQGERIGVEDQRAKTRALGKNRGQMFQGLVRQAGVPEMQRVQTFEGGKGLSEDLQRRAIDLPRPNENLRQAVLLLWIVHFHLDLRTEVLLVVPQRVRLRLRFV